MDQESGKPETIEPIDPQDRKGEASRLHLTIVLHNLDNDGVIKLESPIIE